MTSPAADADHVQMLTDLVANPLNLTPELVDELSSAQVREALKQALVDHREEITQTEGKAREYAVTMRVLSVLVEGITSRNGGDRIAIPTEKVVHAADIAAWYDDEHARYVIRVTRDPSDNLALK